MLDVNVRRRTSNTDTKLKLLTLSVNKSSRKEKGVRNLFTYKI